MKKLILAGIFAAIVTSVAPLSSSAHARSGTQQQTSNPLDAFARDASAYGGQTSYRRNMRRSYMNRSHRGYRSRMMQQRRMIMRRGSMMRDPSSYGGQPAARRQMRMY